MIRFKFVFPKVHQFLPLKNRMKKGTKKRVERDWINYSDRCFANYNIVIFILSFYLITKSRDKGKCSQEFTTWRRSRDNNDWVKVQNFKQNERIIIWKSWLPFITPCIYIFFKSTNIYYRVYSTFFYKFFYPCVHKKYNLFEHILYKSPSPDCART